MIRVLSLILYILFMHVYPVVHWHAHEHDGDMGVHASVHPPNMSIETHDHDHHDEEHAHEDDHVDGTWEFVSQNQSIRFVPIVHILFHFEQVELDAQIHSRLPREYPLKLPRDHLPTTESNRAPPSIA